jgi:HNH endonuclease
MSLKEKLLSRYYVGESGCWIYTGGWGSNGYGVIWHEGKQKSVHRVSFELYKGPVPPGLYVLHKCNNKPCFNPDHLYAGTAKQNTADMIEAGRFVDNSGERNGRAILSKREVGEIKFLIAEGQLSYREIGQIYGAAPNTVKTIASGRNWPLVEPVEPIWPPTATPSEPMMVRRF